jgi:flagellar protein FliO/FliZ
MDILFGAEMPLPVKFFMAFIVVLGLIGGTAYLVRRFGSSRLGGAGGRGRQPRLAVIDAAAVDGRRRLILIRRDNIEHLLMIGGPSDVVIEPNIVRGAAAPREAAPPRPPAAPEPLPRAVPLGEGNMWPLQPHAEPALAPVPPAAAAPPPPPPRAQRPPVHEEPPQWSLEHEAPPPQPRQSRPPADPLAGLAAELARGQPDANPARPTRERPPAPDTDAEPTRGQPVARPRVEPRIEPKIEPRMEHPVPQPSGPFTAAADQNLAEMAQRLEAALRRPGGAARSKEPRAASADAPPTPVTAAESDMQPETPAPPPPEQRSARAAPAVARPARSDGRPAQPQQKSVYDSLEQEMASLLGRPQGKT